MSLFRVQNNVPEVYPNTSRDFQLLGRLYDCIINGIKFDTDSILKIINTDSIDSKLLKLLETKLGFFTSKDITDKELRYVLSAFPIILKNKGSLKGIKQAVYVFLKAKSIKSNVIVEIFNRVGSHPYTVQISLNMSYTDTMLLDEILKYILPTGYVVAYSFYEDIGEFSSYAESRIGANIIIVKDSVSSLIRGDYIAYRNRVEDRLIGSVGETQLSLPYDTTYIGSFNSVGDFPEYIENQDKHVGELLILKNGNPWDNDFNVSSYRYSYNYVNDSYEWALMNSSEDANYDVYRKAKYGYFDVNTGLFYSSKDSEYIEDQTFSQTGLRIGNDTTPDNAVIRTFDNGILYDNRIEKLWYALNDRWVKEGSNGYGLEIVGENPNNEVNRVVPKEGLILYRPESRYVVEAIWKTIMQNNKYVWSTMITDKDEIEQLKDLANAVIDGNPELCKIVLSKDGYLFDKSSKNSWYFNDNSWVQYSDLEKNIFINGDPNVGAFIVPNENVHVYSNDTSWTASIDQYSEEIIPDVNTLYIDNSTSCGYKYNANSQEFEKVLHFIRAENVYNVSEDELNEMIENGTLRPAFKNDTTIFEDIFDNVFLL